MKTIKLFAVTTNSDRTEGRGAELTVCFTENREVAAQIVNTDEYAHHFGIMGTKGGKYDIKKVKLQIIKSAKEFKVVAKKLKCQ